MFNDLLKNVYHKFCGWKKKKILKLSVGLQFNLEAFKVQTYDMIKTVNNKL